MEEIHYDDTSTPLDRSKTEGADASSIVLTAPSDKCINQVSEIVRAEPDDPDDPSPHKPLVQSPVEATEAADGSITAVADEPPTATSALRYIDPASFPDPPPPNAKGIPPTSNNLEYLLQQAGGRVRFNVIKKRPEIILPDLQSSVHNRANVTLTRIRDMAFRNGMKVGDTKGLILAIADRHQFNPVADWICSKPWDGTDRLPEICDTLVAEDDYPAEFKDVLIRKWLLSAVAAALMPVGYHGRGVLTLQGEQGLGKSTWFGALVPDPALRAEVVKLGHYFDGGNKDTKLEAVRHWLVELGELEGSIKRDFTRLKSFLTDDIDKIRPVYAEVEAEYPRQTVFGASVNKRDFLQDRTGNSRFWVIPVVDLNYLHTIDMQQVFAQLRCEFEQGAQWWLTDTEEVRLAEGNREYEAVCPIEQQVIQALDVSPARNRKLTKMTAKEMLAAIGIDRPTNQQSKDCNAALRRHLGNPKKIQGYYYWQVPLADRNSLPSGASITAIDDDEY